MLRLISATIAILDRREKKQLFMFTVMRVALVAFDLATLAAVGLVFSEAASALASQPDGEIPFWGSLVPEFGSDNFIFFCIGATVGIAAKFVLAAVLLTKTQLFLASLEAKYSGELVNDVISDGVSRLEASSLAELQWLWNRSTQIVFTQLLGIGLTFLADSLLVLAILISATIFSPVSSLVAAVYFGATLMFVQAILRPRIVRQGRNLRNATVAMTNDSRNLVVVFREILVGQRSEYFVKKFARSRFVAAASQAKYTVLSQLPRPFLELVLTAGFTLLVVWASTDSSFIPRNEGLGLLAVAALRLASLFIPIQKAFASLNFLSQQVEEGLDQLKALGGGHAEQEPASEARASAPKLASSHPEILVDDVSYSYPGAGSPALENISFEVAPHDFIAITGPSGSGKTTLVDLMLGLRTPSRGSISLGGWQASDALTSAQFSLGYVPQRPGIIPGSLRLNLSLGDVGEGESDSRCWDALEKAHLAEVVRRLPDGLDSDLGKHGDALSGGQLQRLGIARALYRKPRVLFLDEPTSAVNLNLSGDLVRTLSELNSDGMTVILISHSEAVARQAKRRIFLENGKLIKGPS
jgi:ATP-binding cassette subfamily C protein